MKRSKADHRRPRRRNRVRSGRPAAAKLLAAIALATGLSAFSIAQASAASTTAGSAIAHKRSGRMALKLQGARGPEAFALTGERVVVNGTVWPFVAGERIAVHFYRDGHIVDRQSVALRPGHGGKGIFLAGYASSSPGQIRVVAVHPEDSRLSLFAAGTKSLNVISPDLSIGSRGQAVWTLQRSLAGLHYAIPLSGYYDEATADAVIAFRKMTGLERLGSSSAEVFTAIKRGEGAYRVRFPHDGRHVEANLEKQVLVEIEARGRVRAIYPTSSGKPSTPTVVGHFAVYRKEPGVNSELMYESDYFISGYAIHGYPEVPTYAASHGCLRVPNLDAQAIYAWLKIGTPVDVYG